MGQPTSLCTSLGESASKTSWRFCSSPTTATGWLHLSSSAACTSTPLPFATFNEHPAEVETFIDYYHVQNDKLISRLVETFGDNILPAEVIAEARRKAAEVKQDFMVPVCDHPGAKMRLNHTWSKLDFVAMAKKTGDLGKLIIPGY